jgi:dsDNA-specific endonuclease/ATPase MutS2
MKWLNRWRYPKVAHHTQTTEDDDISLGLNEDPYTEPVVWEITDTIDLHHVAPRDIQAVVTSYLVEARAHGLLRLRVIHGKGIGVQRANVRRLLAETVFVREFFDAPDASGWGATIVLLQAKESDDA